MPMKKNKPSHDGKKKLVRALRDSNNPLAESLIPLILKDFYRNCEPSITARREKLANDLLDHANQYDLYKQARAGVFDFLIKF